MQPSVRSDGSRVLVPWPLWLNIRSVRFAARVDPPCCQFASAHHETLRSFARAGSDMFLSSLRCSRLHYTRLPTYEQGGEQLADHSAPPVRQKRAVLSEPVAYRGGGLGCSTPPPKFRRYRWSPRSHEQEEPASRFPFVVHCVLIRL